MTEQERFIRILRATALVAMSIVVILLWGHIAFGWFKDGSGADVWYYPLTISLQVFFILVQLWIVRMRRQAS